MNMQGVLYDHFEEARLRIFGTRRFAYLYGADKDEQFVENPEITPRATDILTLNDLRVPFTFLHVRKNHLRQKVRHQLQDFDVVVNGVTNPDTNAKVLETIARMLKPYKGTVINPPAAVLGSGRDRISRKAAAVEGILAPNSVRLRSASAESVEGIAQRAGVGFPAILRPAGAHRGTATFLARDAQDAALKMEPGKDYYLTTYTDYRSGDGLYRKIRFFFIGEGVIIRHQIVSDNWNVHVEARDRFMATRPRLVQEERRLIEGGIQALSERTQRALRGMRAAVGLDFFGLDCSLMEDGSLLLFEANATMNFSNASADDPQFNYLKTAFQQGRNGFRSMLVPGYKSARAAVAPAGA